MKIDKSSKGWPYYWPSGKKVPLRIKMVYIKAIKQQRNRKRWRSKNGKNI